MKSLSKLGAHAVVGDDVDAGVQSVENKRKRRGHEKQVPVFAGDAEPGHDEDAGEESDGGAEVDDENDGDDDDHFNGGFVSFGDVVRLGGVEGGFFPPFGFLFEFDDKDGGEDDDGEERDEHENGVEEEAETVDFVTVGSEDEPDEGFVQKGVEFFPAVGCGVFRQEREDDHEVDDT